MNDFVQTNESVSNYWILIAIILLEGFVTISLEILTIRQLIPVAGNSVIVTSLIIGVFLLFLAYGYRRGGTYKYGYQKVLKKNFTIAAIGLGIGLSYFFVDTFFAYLEHNLSQNLLWPLTIYLLLVTAPLVYLLGQTVPITFNLFKEKQHIGMLGGRVLHISTLGSFLGAVLTSLLLFNYFGVAWTVFINFVVLAFLVLLLVDVRRDVGRIVLLIGSGVVIYALNVQLENNFFVLTNNYANYRVINNFSYPPNNHGKLLDINNSNSSFIDNKLRAFPYAENIKRILFNNLRLQHKQILVLGAGGFTLSAEQDNQNQFTYVDIDPKIKKVTQQYFLANIRGEFVADDARHYLKTTSKRYDVVIADAYSNKYSVPAHLLTQEFFVAIRHVLAPNGIMIVNLIARPMLEDAYSKRMDNTIRSVFADCMVMPEYYVAQAVNILYICRNVDVKQDTMIYTDNLNRSTLDFFKNN